jgi:hypothetical protein
LISEYYASIPFNQFGEQKRQEYNRLFNPPPGSGLVGDDHLLELADETVKYRWIEQGIWDDKWEGRPWSCTWAWKHEEPLEPESESESETDSETGSNAHIGRTKQR